MVMEMAPKTLNNDQDEIQAALAQNDEDWQKRMLLLVMIMIVAVLGLG